MLGAGAPGRHGPRFDGCGSTSSSHSTTMSLEAHTLCPTHTIHGLLGPAVHVDSLHIIYLDIPWTSQRAPFLVVGDALRLDMFGHTF